MKWPRRKTWFRALLVLIGVGIGTSIGLAGYTFHYAKGFSYLTDDPAACMNCHIMRAQFDGWVKASHGKTAVCNDCHAPHATIPKYWVKARNGFWHSFHFTRGDFPEPIRISPVNLRVTEKACRHCHGEIVHAMGEDTNLGRGREPVQCTHCHVSVGHLR